MADETNREHASKFYAALVEAQRSIDGVVKGSTNSFHRYKYASAEDVIAAGREALFGNGLALLRTDSELRGDENLMLHSVYALVHTSGYTEEFTNQIPVCAEKGKPADKAVFAAMTEGLAYMLRDLLLIPRTDENSVSARDDRNYQPRKVQQAAQASPDANAETDDQRATRIMNSLKKAASKDEIAALGKQAKGLPEKYVAVLKAAADGRRAELGKKPGAANG